MNAIKITLAALAAASTSSFAAGPQVARVVSANPVYVNMSTQQSVCSMENVAAAPQPSATGAVVGAALGGLLAHNLAGHDKHRDLDTVGGALVGGVIGNGVASQGQSQVQQRQVCHNEFVPTQTLAGYDVTYDFAGQRSTARMNAAPGQFINVDVTVRPSVNQGN